MSKENAKTVIECKLYECIVYYENFPKGLVLIWILSNRKWPEWPCWGYVSCQLDRREGKTKNWLGMNRFLPVTKAAHRSEGNVYKNTGSLKTAKSILTTNFTFVVFVMFPMNTCLTANIWKEAGKKWDINPLPEADDGVFYCVMSHSQCHVTRVFQCCEVWLVSTTVWRHHLNSAPASVWDRWWKDEPYLSQYHCIAFTGIDGALFCRQLWVTTTLLLHSIKPEESQRVSQKCWYLPGKLHSIKTQNFRIRR